MHRTTAPNSSGGLFVDKNPGVTPGTTMKALDLNMWQEELANLVELHGQTLSSANDEQVRQAIIGLSHAIGEPVFNLFNKSASITFPAVRVDDADHDISTTNWPDLITALRAEKLRSGSTTDFSVTVSGSTITFGATTDGDRLLAALLEDELVHGSYTNWLSVNIAGTDYAITNVNTGSRTLTVTGTPASGAQTAIVYPYRIAGSSTTARLRKVGGRALMSHSDDDGELLSGLRRRDRMQGHWHDITGLAGAKTGTTSTAGANRNWFAGNGGGTTGGVEGPITDGANGTPRTGKSTIPPLAAGYLYIWGGRYVP